MEQEYFTCDADGCTEPVIFHLVWARIRQCVREQHFCDKHAQVAYDNYNQDTSLGSGDLAAKDGAKCFDIELVMLCETHSKQLVAIREVGRARSIPILTGATEACGIIQKLKRVPSPWATTHDAMLESICALGGVLEDVLIDDFNNQTYYAKLRIRQNGKQIDIDVRPSDAFVVAIIADKPIFIADQVLAKLATQPPAADQ